MINKRLIKTSKDSIKYVIGITICQIISMLVNIALIFAVADFIRDIYLKNEPNYILTMAMYIIAIAIRATMKKISATLGVKASSEIKIKLRSDIYNKILSLGGSYTKNISTAQVIQVASEGIDQLEMYFANYLPQFFYCMSAPLILFLTLSNISFKASLILFLCVPLIPISIVVVQKIAKKLLEKYWGLYTGLGDDFLENIQGMTTLKIYQADEFYHKKMNESAQNFRKVTMKVLTMQLNSIIVMDIIAYGGASLGTIIAVLQLQSGAIDVFGACVIILLSSEFFLPMRLLGSFFHIAMNGLSACKKMFEILDIQEFEHNTKEIKTNNACIKFENVGFAYNEENVILKDISFVANTGLTSIVGVSGSGKSTISSLIISKLNDYNGDIFISDTSLKDISKNSIYKNITRATDKGYIFAPTVRANLLMANPNASDEDMINALEKANIWSLFKSGLGLDTVVCERGSNFSGGEKQRLNIARAILKNSNIYIFDEVTSNIDAQSEDDIMKVILELAKEKTVVLISHRLHNVVSSNEILMLKDGVIIERGTHEKLMQNKFEYAKLYSTQKELEEVIV